MVFPPVPGVIVTDGPEATVPVVSVADGMGISAVPQLACSIAVSMKRRSSSSSLGDSSNTWPVPGIS